MWYTPVHRSGSGAPTQRRGGPFPRAAAPDAETLPRGGPMSVLLPATVLLDSGAPPAAALAGAGPPDWAGRLGLSALVGALGLLAWWLLASPLPPGRRPVGPAAPSERVLRVRRLMAAVVLLSGVLLRVGAPWDELWHRLYGVPFGEDLLWPPHLLLYASFALSFALIAAGLAAA